MQCSAVTCIAVQRSAVQRSDLYCSVVQCSAVTCIAVYCSALHCSVRDEQVCSCITLQSWEILYCCNTADITDTLDLVLSVLFEINTWCTCMTINIRWLTQHYLLCFARDPGGTLPRFWNRGDWKLLTNTKSSYHCKQTCKGDNTSIYFATWEFTPPTCKKMGRKHD